MLNHIYKIKLKTCQLFIINTFTHIFLLSLHSNLKSLQNEKIYHTLNAFISHTLGGMTIVSKTSKKSSKSFSSIVMNTKDDYGFPVLPGHTYRITIQLLN